MDNLAIKPTIMKRKTFPKNLLCDTWWYGLTRRMSQKQFRDLAQLRKQQGFTAIQLVVGIPPEVGPKHPSGASEVGAAWRLNGEINEQYLQYAKERIGYLNSLGFTVIVYGGWGQQIAWMGVPFFKNWWQAIITHLDGLNVIYCITGESNLWIGYERLLLLDKSTGDFPAAGLVKRILNRFSFLKNITNGKERRKKAWSEVLEFVAQKTKKPLIIHTVPDEFSYEAVTNAHLLSAVTVQTSHDESSRNKLWQMAITAKEKYPELPFVNLEPWYEGIRNQFYAKDQLFAFWVSSIAGADGFCYGAHGIWNVGEGTFLAHWGRQTFDEAVLLKTPELVGASFQLAQKLKLSGKPEVIFENGELLQIKRGNVVYIPDVKKQALPEKYAKLWLPEKGLFVKEKPKNGQVVVIL